MTDSTLSPDRWQQVQDLFHSALEQPANRRAQFLDAACREDAELRGAVASLLQAHEQSGLIGLRPMDPVDVQETVTAALADRYTIERPVGTGGMATVFLAEDRKHRRKVAIKVLRPELSLGVERFLREIEIAAGLQHPHILPLFDSGAADGLLYYVMPYVEGPTLAARLQRDGSLSTEETTSIASDVLGALDYAHRVGVVHRDVKPSNILLSTSTGHALVADFGIARAISAAEDDTLTVPGAAIGTPGYMPPEQVQGEQVTAATDIYAAALVFYECWTGLRYEGASNPTEWAKVPAEVQPALRRALEDDPRRRWESARTFRDALLTGSSSGRGGAFARWMAVAATVLLAITGWWLSTRSSDGALPDTSRLVVLPFSVRGGGDLAYLGEGMVDLLSTKLDGAGSWRTVDPRAVLSLTNRSAGGGLIEPSAARQIARQLQASMYVLGNIIEVGDRIRLDASLYGPDSGDQRIGTASAEGDASEVLALLDRLAAELLSSQGGPGGRLTQIAAVTTQSLPALKSYLRGVHALRIGEFPVAAAAFQEAVGLDSVFALAWYQLSVAADWLLRSDLSLDAADQAVRYADRLSERDRRLLEALQFNRLGDFSEADRRYRSIIGTYPDEIEAWSQLGELLFHHGPRHGRPIDASRETWSRLTELEPDEVTAYIHTARIESIRGDLAALDTLTRRALELAPEGDRRLEMRLLRAYVLGDERARLQLASMLPVAPEDLLGELMWVAGTFIVEPDAFEYVLSVVTDPGRSANIRALGQGGRAFLALSRGQWEAARRHADAMTAIHPVWGVEYGSYLALSWSLIADTVAVRSYRDQLLTSDWASLPTSMNRTVWFSASDGLHQHFRWYLLALSDALLGDDAGAARYQDSLRTLTSPRGSGSLSEDQILTIDGFRAFQGGAFAEAAMVLGRSRYHIWQQFATASPFFSQGLDRFLYARALEEAGRQADAITWYGSLFDTGLHDRVFWAPAHLRLGRIHEAAGDLDLARRHFRQVLELWADADSTVGPLIEEARTAFTRLGG